MAEGRGEAAEEIAERDGLIRVLFALYEAWNEADVYDPGRELLSDGVRITGITSLLGAEGALALEQAWESIEPHERRIRKIIARQHVSEPVKDGQTAPAKPAG